MSKPHVLAKLLQPIGPIRHQYQHSHLKIQMYIYSPILWYLELHYTVYACSTSTNFHRHLPITLT